MDSLVPNGCKIVNNKQIPLDKPRGASSTISRIDQFYVSKRLDKKRKEHKNLKLPKARI
jgi:hypothetical protein